MRHSAEKDTQPTTHGILKPEEAEKAFHLLVHPAHPELRPWIEFYWNVEWDLGDRQFRQTVVTNPTVDLSFEDDLGTNGPGRFLIVTGVVPRSYHRHLSGRGDVFAAHFQPAQFRAWWSSGVQALTGRTQRLGDGPRVWEAGAAALLPGLLDLSFENRVRTMDEFLLDHRPEPDPIADEIQRLVAVTRQDRSLWDTGVLAGRRAVSVRTNQRQFLEYVGVGPKWVVMRHRIQAAIETLDRERTGGVRQDLTSLALNLGYYDLAHFSREYANLIGESPDHYRA